MGLTPKTALAFLQEHEFFLYHAKSINESLLIHSLNVYALVDNILPYTQLYTEAEKEMMRWAALLHDYGKVANNWQKLRHGRHRVSPGTSKFEELRSVLRNGIDRYSKGIFSHLEAEQVLDDILFIIEFHHGSGLQVSTPKRNQMKDLISECDRVVSQTRISEGLIRTLNSIIDRIRYKLFIVELIDHPISPIVIGGFDYVFYETGSIRPILFSAISTLFLADVNTPIPSLDDVNAFVNEQLEDSKGVLRYDRGNARIYTDERSFLSLACQGEQFISQATAYANNYCTRMRNAAEKDPSKWTDDQEECYLYGRVCGTTYNTILDLCDAKKKYPRACLEAGGRYGMVTVKSLETFGLRKATASYEQTLRAILNQLNPLLKEKLDVSIAQSKDQPHDTPLRYDVRDLLVPDSSVYPSLAPLNPKDDALKDYDRYWEKRPLDVCPTCNLFPQGNVTAAAFPKNSPLGGTVEVFYTSYMRLVKKEGGGKRGVSFCQWCSKWWDLISTHEEGKRQMYHFCVMPHHLFARLDWREILQPAKIGDLIELGSTGTLSSSGVYPHIAMLSLRGRDREALLQELAADADRGDEQILDRLYKYGLKGTTVVTNPTSSQHLLTCGSIHIDISDWPIVRKPLRLLSQKKRRYAAAIRALQQSPYAFGTFLSDGSIPITKKMEKEVKQMVEELAQKTGLSFLSDIWIEGKDRVENASKVIRGMNETLRRLKGKEDDASLIDAMVGKGFHIALSTRKGLFRSKDNQPKEEAAIRRTAEKLFKYKDQTYRRTELVRAMIYTLAYFSKPELAPEQPDNMPLDSTVNAE